MQNPRRSRGTAAETRAWEAATLPVSIPCRTRSTSSSPGFCTKIIRKISTAPLSIERTTITLRPWRSETAPQIGAQMVIAMVVPANSQPDQISTCPLSCTPRCWT